jgi:two-component system OmpR family sensor kinase
VHDAQARDPGRPVTLAPGSDAVHVLGDEDKLRQVVSNLVTNALTHTPAGTPVQLTVRAHDTSVPDLPPVAQAGELSEQQPAPLGVLEVHDDGPGIPVEAATQIFNRFYSFVPSAHVDADQLRNGNRGGSGLGLAITAAILEAHNGRIELHTAPRQGTTFRVLLPLA